MEALGILGKFHALAPGTLEAKDIADLALFLASDDSKHINGAIVPADMGWAAF
jgi:enoyl-[acyl-carrier-protein] reductase (NADH)